METFGVDEFKQKMWRINQGAKAEVDPNFNYDIPGFMIRFMMDQKIPYPGITERFFYYVMQFKETSAGLARLYIIEDFVDLITETCGKGKL